jgi:hypothetical protein
MLAMNMDWKFDDKPNTACYTTTFVLDGSPILRVYHDYDGDWQFHGASDQPATESVAKLVCLADMIRRDDLLNELYDLPYGWRAERATPSSKWKRSKNNPYPSFAENGFYLEDAVWLSQYLSDINPPDARVRENLMVGNYVKLVFRFADEQSDREDNQCERMWVQVTGYDNDGNYIGTIENDPHHDTARYGDIVYFHPLHVADLSTEE